MLYKDVGQGGHVLKADGPAAYVLKAVGPVNNGPNECLCRPLDCLL